MSMKENKSKKMIIMAVVIILVLAVCVLLVVSLAAGGKNDIGKRLSLGNKYLEELDYESAIAEYKAVLDIEPDNEEALEGIVAAYSGWADVYTVNGAYEKAIQVLEEGLLVVRADILENKKKGLENYLLAASTSTGNSEDASAESSVEEEQAPADDYESKLEEESGSYLEFLFSIRWGHECYAIDYDNERIILNYNEEKGDLPSTVYDFEGNVIVESLWDSMYEELEFTEYEGQSVIAVAKYGDGQSYTVIIYDYDGNEITSVEESTQQNVYQDFKQKYPEMKTAAQQGESAITYEVLQDKVVVYDETENQIAEFTTQSGAVEGSYLVNDNGEKIAITAETYGNLFILYEYLPEEQRMMTSVFRIRTSEI